MAITVDTEFVDSRAYITSFHYPYISDVDASWKPESGLTLPRGPGFPSRYEPPRLSFKMYKAMVEGGCGSIADQVLRSKRRSLITPNYIWRNVGNFAGKTTRRLSTPTYYKALDKLRTVLKVDDKIDPLSMSEAASVVPQHTSPGLPYIKTRPGWKKGDVIKRELRYLSDLWRRVGDGESILFPDSAAFGRSYIGKPGDNKVRPVWAIPLSIILQEARFAVPLTQQFIDQKCCRNTGYGCEMMKGGMMWLNGQIAQLNGKYGQTKILMIDYKSFDATVPAWLIRDVFGVIMEKFNLTYRDRICLRKCINYFINTPIQNSDGRRFKKDHGIPCGSMFANVIGSLVNMVVTWYTSTIVMGEYPVMDMFFGDDGIACFRRSVIMDLNEYAKAVQHFFGMKINSKKTYWTSNPVNVYFLGYFNYYGTPFKKAEELIAAMLFSQHLVDEWEYCISKSLCCLLASAGASMDVFMACQAVYKKACLAGADVEKGINLIKENPRTLRHLITMGVEDLILSEKFFCDIKLSIPFNDCSKYTKGVELWCE